MYEYKVICIRDWNKLEDELNKYAKEGWRVISNVFYSQWNVGFVVTLERTKEDY